MAGYGASGGPAVSAAAEVQRRRGALPSGLDVSPGLLGVAHERLPDADLREGDMETLPFGDAAFDAPERSQGTVVHEAMSALSPPEQAGDHAPYALSAPGNLEAALASAALMVVDSGEVVCHWRYASMDDAVRALLCSAGGARAREAAGEHAVREVLNQALVQFQNAQTGVVTMKNTFRWIAACR